LTVPSGWEFTENATFRDVSCAQPQERDVNLTTTGRIGLRVAQVLGSSIVAFFAYRYFSHACFLLVWKGLSLAGAYRGDIEDLISHYFLRLSGFVGFWVGLVPWSKSARSRGNFGTRILPWVFLPDLLVFLVVFALWKDPNDSILAPQTFEARLMFFFGPMPVIQMNAASVEWLRYRFFIVGPVTFTICISVGAWAWAILQRMMFRYRRSAISN
jgi:hypothetical protein